MNDGTDADRARAMLAMGYGSEWSYEALSPLQRLDVDAIAVALAEERERERLTWNPMVGRVMQLAQKWAVSGDPVLAAHGQEIHDAIRGDQ